MTPHEFRPQVLLVAWDDDAGAWVPFDVTKTSPAAASLLGKLDAIAAAVGALPSPPSAVDHKIQNGVGIAYTGPGKLYWILVVNRYMSEGSCTISDGSTWSFPIWLKNEVSFMFVANPPMQFNTSIRCSAVSNYGFELVFGYIPD